MKLDEAIGILQNMNDGYTFKDCEVCISDNKYDEKDCICKSKTCEYLQAIETVLKELEDSIPKSYIEEQLNILEKMRDTSEGVSGFWSKRAMLKKFLKYKREVIK